MLKLKFFALILIMMVAINCFTAVTANDKETGDIAEAVLSSRVRTINFQSIEMGVSNSPSLTFRDGQWCWLLDVSKTNDEAVYINFDLKDSFAYKVGDGTTFDVEVEYYDDGNGFFRLDYDSFDNEVKYGNIEYQKNERFWKTAKFSLDDAYFGNRLSGRFDFRLAVKIQAITNSPSLSKASVAVRKVTVTRHVGKNPIYATASIDEIGNTFTWFQKEKIIHNNFKNVTDRNITADVIYSAVSADNIKLFEITKKLELEPEEEKQVDLDIGYYERCDVYFYYINIKNSSQGIDSVFIPFEFVIVKTDPNGIKNDNMFWAAHLSWWRTYDEGAYMTSLSNAGGIRTGVDFGPRVSRPSGIIQFEATAIERTKNALAKYSLKMLPEYYTTPEGLFGFTSNLHLPSTPEQLQWWRKVVSDTTEYLKDVAVGYEIWNEPNIVNFNTNLDINNRRADGAVYTEMYRVAAEEIKKIVPHAKVAGPSITGMHLSDGREYFSGCLEAGFAQYANALAFHPYQSTAAEKSAMDDTIQWYVDRFREHGGAEDVAIYNTESGYTTSDESVKTHRVQGAQNARAFLMYHARGLSDILVFYNLERKGIIDSNRENSFGAVDNGVQTNARYGKIYQPYISFVQVTALNYIMANSTPAGIYNKDDNVRISKFKSQKFNSDIVTMYAWQNNSDVTVDLGAEYVEYYDDLGNSRTVYGKDGIFYFTLDEKPIYLVGKIDKCEVLPENTLFEYASINVNATVNDVVQLKINKFVEDDYTIEIECPEFLKVAYNNGFVNNKADAAIELLGGKGTSSVLAVNIKKDDRIVQRSHIKVTSNQAILSNISVKLLSSSNLNRWSGTATVQNMALNKVLRGYIEFNSPENFNRLTRIDIGNILKGKKSEVQFNLPLISRKGMYTIEYDIVPLNGEPVRFSQNIDFTLATYAYKQPVIDGVIDPAEWTANTEMHADDFSQIKSIKDWRGVKDLSAAVTLMWDEENFYLAADVKDDVFFQNRMTSNMWNGDSVQIGVFYGVEDFLAIGEASATFHEIAMALTPEGPQAYRHLSQDNVYEAGLCNNYELAVKREETRTLYEFKIPWSELLRKGDQPKEGDLLGFSYLVNDNDGGGRRGWIEYASGIGQAKDTSLFTYMTLIKQRGMD